MIRKGEKHEAQLFALALYITVISRHVNNKQCLRLAGNAYFLYPAAVLHT